MKILRRIDGSICGAVLSSISSTTSWTSKCLASRLGDGRPGPLSQGLHTRAARNHDGRLGHCPRTSSWLSLTFASKSPPASIRTLSRKAKSKGRASHSAATAIQPSRESIDDTLDRDKLLSLVDSEDSGSVDEHLRFHQDPYLRRYAQPDDTDVRISDRRDDVQYPSPRDVITGDEHTARIVKRITRLSLQRLTHPHKVDLEQLYKLYCTLPGPRMLHLPALVRYRFLRALGTPETRDVAAMLRYLSAVADVKSSGLTLRLSEWNCALAFTKGYVRRTIRAEDLEAALQVWREMEGEGGVRGNELTFNMLFDVASKAGNFALADMVYREMESRGIRFNRYHHVSLIHFFGLKMDPDGVRAAYREMVLAGEIIDTLALNCVIASLLRCGDSATAEQVYERMKAAHGAAPALPAGDLMADKIITKTFMMFSKVGRKHPKLRHGFQDASVVSPNLRTYRILVRHFAFEVGDIEKVTRLLEDMAHYRVPLHGAIFLLVFKGFHLHGRTSDSEWSERRLRSVFAALLRALDDGARGLYIDTWLAMHALRAFMTCTASKQAVREAYGELQARWMLEEAQEDFMKGYLDKLMAEKESG